MIRPFFDPGKEPDLRKPVGLLDMAEEIPAIRYNNPGDVSLPIEGWSGGGYIVGIHGQPGYAEFPSMAVGFAAMVQRLRSYITYQHRTNITLIGEVYAQDPTWPAKVSLLANIPIHTVLNPANTRQMTQLAEGIIRQETGKTMAELGLLPEVA